MSYYTANDESSITITPVIQSHYEQYKLQLGNDTRAWLTACNFTARPGQICLCPGNNASITRIFLGLSSMDDSEALAKAAIELPPGQFQLDSELSFNSLLYWGLAQYNFSRYKQKNTQARQLVVDEVTLVELERIHNAVTLVRDLINTPAEDMGPQDLADITEALAEQYGGNFSQVIGDELLTHQFPAIHAVGRASDKAPRLLELNWGDKSAPLVTIVGKGVCFDSGGLDLKPSSGMRQMKKDMGGAAHAIALAQLIMDSNLPLQLKLLIPAVENAVSGNAYRPGDIIATRKGLSVEIGNTDAEGRLILADALTYAAEFSPELILDFATLTGAARVAMGLDIGVMFSNDDTLAHELFAASEHVNDPIWRLPLFKPYLKSIQPAIANLSNSGTSGYGGAITAALFLEQFVDNKNWAHFDIMAFNTASRPGKPEGGEALSLRACYQQLANRFS